MKVESLTPSQLLLLHDTIATTCRELDKLKKETSDLLIALYADEMTKAELIEACEENNLWMNVYHNERSSYSHDNLLTAGIPLSLLEYSKSTSHYSVVSIKPRFAGSGKVRKLVDREG